MDAHDAKQIQVGQRRGTTFRRLPELHGLPETRKRRPLPASTFGSAE
jgi:hypothetical protein